MIKMCMRSLAVAMVVAAPAVAAAHGGKKHKNLKVLADSKKALGDGMKLLSKGLGVKCTACHVKGKLARDAKPAKIAARNFLGAVLEADAPAVRAEALKTLLQTMSLKAAKDERKIWSAIEVFRSAKGKAKGKHEHSDARIRRLEVPAPAGARYSNFAATAKGLVLSWVEPRAAAKGAQGGFRVRTAELRGARWSQPTTVVESAEVFANWADFPSVTADSRGRTLVHWPQKSGAAKYAYDVRIARSKGRTWMLQGKLHDDETQTEHGFASFVRQGATIRAFWLDGREMAKTEHGPMTLRTALIGDRVTDGELLDGRVCECCATDAAVTDDGPIVVYRDRSDAEIRDVQIIRRVNGAWTTPKKVHHDGWNVIGCPVNGPAVAAEGRAVVVAWFTGAGDRGHVRVAFSKDSGSSFSSPIEVDASAARAPLGRVDVQMHRGDAIVSWMAPTSDELAELRVARVTPTGVAGTRTFATTSPARASGFAKTLIRDDELYMTWTEPEPEFRVRLARMPLSDLESASRIARREKPIDPSTYTARSLDGAPRALSEYRGQPVLLSFWATWCTPCRDDVPVLVGLHERFSARGLKVIAVSIDEAGAEAAVRAFLAERAVPYEIWRDPDNRASVVFGVTALPATFLIDRNGRVAFASRGLLRSNDPALGRAIKAAL